jgi:hypothetical protein
MGGSPPGMGGRGAQGYAAAMLRCVLVVSVLVLGGCPIRHSQGVDTEAHAVEPVASASELSCARPERAQTPVPAGAPPAAVDFQVLKVPRGPVGLARAAATWTGSEFLIFGGTEPETPRAPGNRTSNYGRWVESPQGTGWSTVVGYGYDPTRGRWRRLPGSPLAGSAPSDPVAWHCNRAFVMTRSGAGYLYDPVSGQTSSVSTQGAPRGCVGTRIESHGSLALLWGCGGCSGKVYDASTDTWTDMGTAGDPVEWSAPCDWLPGVMAGDNFVVLRKYRGPTGGIWNVRTRHWERIPEEGSPEQVNADPVSDGHSVFVLGQRGSTSAIYRYDIAERTWSQMPLPTGLCSLGTATALRNGVLLQAGGTDPAATLCAYDLVHGGYVGTANAHVEGTVTLFGKDHLFVWARDRWTGHGDGEMPRTPTRWIENDGNLIHFRITRSQTNPP